MGTKHILVSGSTNGAIMALLMIVLLLMPDDIFFGSLPAAIISFLTIVLVPPFLVRKISSDMFDVNLSLKHLIPISFLTFIMPLFGATFGLPNKELTSLATLVAISVVGGAVWSLPFATWNHFKGTKDVESGDSQKNITQNINIHDSVVMGNVGEITEDDEE